jgi:hypothetical protein
MNKIMAGKMVFHRIINNSEKKNTIINEEEENNYLNDLRAELGQDINKKKIFKIKNNLIYNKDPNIIYNKDPNIIYNKENNIIYDKENNIIYNIEPNIIEKKEPVIIENKEPDIIENKKPVIIENKEPDIIENKESVIIQNKEPVIIENKQTKRELFFTSLKSIILEKKFIILRENKIKQQFKGKLERNINKKYNFRILDLINYYDIHYKNYKVNSTERNNQDRFYNNIKYLNIFEFYPNNGALSCLLNNKLQYSDKHFIIQNNTEYMQIIEDNKNTHNSFFNIININPEDINISEYLVNCIIFNNISNENYTKILNIIDKNLENLKNNIFDIYFEKISNYDISSLYKTLESISFIKKLSEENREHWINNN